MQNTGAMLQKVAEINLLTLCRYWGATKRGRGDEERATAAILCESDMVHTGNLPRHAKASGQEDGGDPGRNAKVPGGWRRGRRSLRTGKPSTRGGVPTAKAPRLWKDWNKGTQRTRKLSTGKDAYRGAGAMRRNALWRGSATENDRRC